MALGNMLTGLAQTPKGAAISAKETREKAK